MTPDAIRDDVESVIGPISSAERVGGGCVANAQRVETPNGRYFLKWADGAAGQTFEAEAAGLRDLARASRGLDLIVPAPLFVKNAGVSPGFLVLEWIDSGPATGADWSRFGRALAQLHRQPVASEDSPRFGYAVDNWIGRKPQRNGWAASWSVFFGERRLRSQAEAVRMAGAWDPEWNKPLERMITRLGEFLPDDPAPSLLHGDLWSGNVLPAGDGRFALIDPAVYAGHHEADLAMTELFGGFAPEFYAGYRDVAPLQPGYRERREIYNLYHLINHLTHGPGYRWQVEATLRRFS